MTPPASMPLRALPNQLEAGALVPNRRRQARRAGRAPWLLPIVPVDPLISGDPWSGLEIGADGVGDGDQRYLHHLLVRDPEHGGCIPLIRQVEAGPCCAKAAGSRGEHE